MCHLRAAPGLIAVIIIIGIAVLIVCLIIAAIAVKQPSGA